MTVTSTNPGQTSALSGVDGFGRDAALIAALRPTLSALLDRWFHLTIEGRAHLPADGRGILVANHGGALPWDALVLIAALDRAGAQGEPSFAVRPLLEDAVMTTAFLGTFMNRLGCVRASQDNAVRLLDTGALCAVFPEGTQGTRKEYRHRHRLQRFGRGGFVRLALKTGAPLIPVAILGAEDTAPLLKRVEFLRATDKQGFFPLTPLFPWLGPAGLLPLPARWRIRICEPIDARSLAGDAPDSLAVQNVATAVRERLQREVDDLVEARGQAFL